MLVLIAECPPGIPTLPFCISKIVRGLTMKNFLAGLGIGFGIGILIVAERPKIFGDGGVEIGQVVRVEDDALTVDLGIAHPERVKEPELFA